MYYIFVFESCLQAYADTLLLSTKIFVQLIFSKHIASNQMYAETKAWHSFDLSVKELHTRSHTYLCVCLSEYGWLVIYAEKGDMSNELFIKLFYISWSILNKADNFFSNQKK